MTTGIRLKHKLKQPNKSWVASSLLVGMALNLYLILTCAIALAAPLTWEEYAREVRRIEEEIGEYADWPAAQKEELIHALIDMEHIKESDASARLFEASVSETDKHALADQIMLGFLGAESNPIVKKDGARSIRWDSITRAILGSNSSQWTPEQRVWFQQVTNMFGRQDPDTLVLPNNADLPVAEAIAIAKRAIIGAFDISEDALDASQPVVDLYITNQFEASRPDYRRWSVHWIVSGEKGPHGYTAIIDENGHVIADTDLGWPHVQELALEEKTRQDGATPLTVQAFREYAKEERCYFPWLWPMETKADYSRRIRPQVIAALKSGDLSALANPSFNEKPIRAMIDSTAFAYGLPEKGHIQESEAFQAAWRVLADEYGFSADMLDRYAVYPSFDVTDPDSPLWKLLFFPDSFEDMETVLLYKVELSALTGDVAATHLIDWDRLFRDPAYDRLLY